MYCSIYVYKSVILLLALSSSSTLLGKSAKVSSGYSTYSSSSIDGGTEP